MEHDAGVDGRRAQRQLDARAGVQADAGRADRILQRSLSQHGVGCRVTRGGRSGRSPCAKRLNILASRASVARPPRAACARDERRVAGDSPHRVNPPACAGTPGFPTDRTPAPRRCAGVTAARARRPAGRASRSRSSRSRARRRCRCRCARRPSRGSASFGGRRCVATTAPPRPVAIIVTRSRSSIASSITVPTITIASSAVNSLIVFITSWYSFILRLGRRGDVDQHAARAGEVHVLEQRTLHRLLRRDARAVGAACRRRAHHRHARLRPSRCARRRSRR